MADALASGASVLYGRGGSSPPSPTAKILGSVKASEDFLFAVAVGVGLGLKQRQIVGLSFNPPLTLSGTYGQVSGTYRWIPLTYRCFSALMPTLWARLSHLSMRYSLVDTL